MTTVDTMEDRYSASGLVPAGEEGLLGSRPWREFVTWMQVYGSLDPDLLAKKIQNCLGGWPQGSGDEDLSEEQLFNLMVIRMAVFDAAVEDAPRRADFRSLARQIQQHFSRLWVKLGWKLNQDGSKKLKTEVLRLCNDDRYRRKPDVVIDTFRPTLVGVASFDSVLGAWPDPPAEGQEAVGPALYRTTLRASSRALMVAASLQTTLARVVEEDEKESRRAAAVARATVQGESAASTVPVTHEPEAHA